MKVVSLASGSGGNAYCVESGGDILLIDCGICNRDLCARCRACGLDPDRISAVVFTHNHVDHIKGVDVFHRRHPDATLFANLMTADAIASVMKMDESEFVVFENGQSFEAGPFEVCAFSIPHDVPDPVGYLIRVEGVTYFHATDVGSPLDSIGVHLAEADIATLESNHDPVMLHSSQRPESLKQRIRGPRGHLSNQDAASLVRRFASPRLTTLALAHLSGECNEPCVAEREMREALAAAGRADVALRILSQDKVVEL
ncbi:MAG: MBL fold metallo-hydrolase [Kiritimatiellae bacterium]|nr:MBL fold metallo-hydrolase [Kiritimatiellia bacterium]